MATYTLPIVRPHRLAQLRQKYTNPFRLKCPPITAPNTRECSDTVIAWYNDTAHRSISPFARLFRHWQNGYRIQANGFESWGHTPRIAYRNACRQQRLAQHDVSVLLRDLARARRTIDSMRAAMLDVPADQLDTVLADDYELDLVLSKH